MKAWIPRRPPRRPGTELIVHPEYPIEVIPRLQARPAEDWTRDHQRLRIVRAVCRTHRVTIDEVRGPSRSHRIKAVRHEIMYRLKASMGLSLGRIGQIVNRDHTTVLHGIAAHAIRNGLPQLSETTRVTRMRRTDEHG